ncbi:extracellular matrix protein PelG [Sulfuriferula multivorans]|uniref:Extracellular matrix protein PelG n=1 Tax=Sulfuriferula multivorans TaxID=1559896 RepID=A0A401K011_9PROT|nr:exopolysaccharide Pel transporter PelG [Sulfuriferula multivorans]GCB02270.1 extracellular matrix protein PelG [Sulfuriferula multivorans]
MAGIGFEIKKILRRDSYLAMFSAYAYAGIIGSGPWVLSILGVLIIGLFSLGVVLPHVLITQFQVTITHLIAMSLILTGFLQLGFTRYIADRLFEKNTDAILPNFIGAIFITTLISGLIGMALALFAFPEQDAVYRLLLIANFVVLCNIWIATIFLSGMKNYKAILVLYTIGYGFAVVAAIFLRGFGLNGLLSGMLLGHFTLMSGMMLLIIRSYPSNHFIEFDFLRKKRMFASLIWTGFFFNLGVWIDKYIFWYTPSTGKSVIGVFNASLIYDLPIFLAYLSIIPGMAVFLVRMETDFVGFYQKFYDAVRDGGTLDYIEEMRDEMVETARQGIFEIIKIQAMAVLIVFVAAPALLKLIGISQYYLSLLYVDVVAAGLQVVFLGIMNVLFYLDKRVIALILTALFAALNLVFSLLSIQLGANWYGYGFAVSLLITVVVGLYWLDRKLAILEYETFMLQK